MARPKEFDRGQVLDRAMDVFWEKGYESASLQDLVERMGIGRASLYDTFGSKRALFGEALDLYADRMEQEFFEPLNDTGPVRDVIAGFLDQAVERLVTCRHQGCLMLKATLASCRDDPELAEQVRHHFSHVDGLFRSALERGQDSDELPPDLDVQSLARRLNTGLQGLFVRSAIEPDRAVLRDIADGILIGFDAWLSPPQAA